MSGIGDLASQGPPKLLETARITQNVLRIALHALVCFKLAYNMLQIKFLLHLPELRSVHVYGTIASLL